MASLMRGLMSQAARYDFSWRLLDKTMLRWSRHAEHARQRRTANCANPLEQQALEAIAPDLVVRHGVFAGMRYPDRRSVGSALVPKLLGSYEREIQPLLERLTGEDYSDVVNVGCAEGYYAVGLAMRMPGARVHAYDTNTTAVQLCEQMARLNGVYDRISIGAFCSAEMLAAMTFDGRALIVCDCEGYELELFTPPVIEALAAHDVLVEAHDFIDIRISPAMRQRFAATHNIEIMQSVDDIQKAHTYSYPELDGFDLADRKTLLAERRPAMMEWFFFKSRR